MIELRTHEDHGPAWEKMGSYSGGLAFNIGANIGQAAHHLAPNFGRVVAFEPCAESFAFLEAEAEPNVSPVFAAVSDHEGTVRLTESSYSITTGQLTTGQSLHWGDSVGEREVPCTTVDAQLLAFGPPDLIQIDTEGHEVFVLIGAKYALANRPDLFVEVHRRENEQKIRQLTPGYEWEMFHWPGLRPNSVLNDHFWMAGHADA